MSVSSLLVLLAVGALMGSWTLSGVIPTIIYYGLEILTPNWFYLTSCITCAVVAFSCGSSWTVAGTIGISLMGVSIGMGISPEITAGAIISGVYFGDKMSPLSDTTNLASAVAGTDLIVHIKHMLWTTGPSFLIAMIIFTKLGLSHSDSYDFESIAILQNQIEQQFNPNILLLVPLAIVFIMAMKKFPAFPNLMFAAVIGGVFAVIFQPEQVIRLAGMDDEFGLLKGVWISLYAGFSSESGLEILDHLLSRGGLSNMVGTISLLLSVITFGSVMECTGMLHRVANSIFVWANSAGQLILSTICTCIGINLLAGDQYIAIVLPGKMYRAEFTRRYLAPQNLSRTLEDSATLTSPLIPWNTCGLYMAATLGVATLAYAPFAFFNWINLIVAIIYGFLKFKIVPMENEQTEYLGSNIELDSVIQVKR